MNGRRIRRYLPCRVAGETLCIDMDLVLEIRRNELAGSSRDLSEQDADMGSGAQRMPIIDLARVFGLRASEAPVDLRMVVVEIESRHFGVLVDGVAKGLEISEDRLFSLPAAAGPIAMARFSGVVMDGDRVLLVPSRQALSGRQGPEGAGRPTSRRRVRATQPAQVIPEGQGGSSAVPRRSSRSARMVVFRTANSPGAGGDAVAFGLSIRQAAEILDFPALTSVPTAPPGVAGLANWRGQPIVVFDVDRYLGWRQPASSSCKRLLVVRAVPSSQMIGLVVHDDLQGASLPSSSRVVDGHPSLPARFARGIFEIGERTLAIPDLSFLVSQAD